MKIAICGLGRRIGHVAGFLTEQVPDARIMGYVDPEPTGRAYLESIGVSPGRPYDRLETMLDNVLPDLLLVGSPNHMHIGHLITGLERGVRIFAEKPVVVSEAETFALLEKLAIHGAESILVGLVLRYSPLYRELRRWMAKGALGNIASIEASEHITPEHGAFFMRDWRRLQRYSGGFMLEKCCHDLDIYQSIVGARASRVASFGSRRIFTPANAALEPHCVYHAKPDGWSGQPRVFESDADIVDNQVALIEYENGVSMCFHTNLNVPDEFRRFCIVGDRGTAEGDFHRNFLRIDDATSSMRLADWSFQEPFGPGHYGSEPLMIADIVAHLLDDAPLPVSILDALESGLTALKIDEARTTGRVVDLTQTWKTFDSFGVQRSAQMPLSAETGP